MSSAGDEHIRAGAPSGSAFHAVDRQVVSQAVHDQLRHAILGGAFAPGDPLPGERALAQQFGVNRHAVREAIKRLQQARLVEVAHGGATRVRDWRATAGLDVLPDLAFGGGRLPDADVLHAALEMRQGIGVDVARRCAERGAPGLAADLQVRLSAARAAPEAELADRYADFWNVLVDASANVAYRLAYNSLLAALAPIRELADAASEPEHTDLDAQDELVAAIVAGEGDRAGRLARELLGRMPERARMLLATENAG